MRLIYVGGKIVKKLGDLEMGFKEKIDMKAFTVMRSGRREASRLYETIISIQRFKEIY
jgi:hypothetical protein